MLYGIPLNEWPAEVLYKFRSGDLRAAEVWATNFKLREMDQANKKRLADMAAFEADRAFDNYA